MIPFLFDPAGEHHSPRRQGWRLLGGEHGRLAAVGFIDRTLALWSGVAGLELLRAKAGGERRFRDPRRGEDLSGLLLERPVR